VVQAGGDLDRLLPVIEPVLSGSTADVLRCLDALSNSSQRVVVEINPSKQDFAADPAPAKTLRKTLEPAFAEDHCVIPGMRISSTTTQKSVESFFKVYPDRPLALVLTSPSLSDGDLKAVVIRAEVEYVFVLDGRITSKQLAVIPSNKFIETRDNFNRMARNSDYGGAELFTDRHKQIGSSLAGVGDYTIVGRELMIGGGQPDTVAIHATYKNSKTGDIWVEHFRSTDRDRNEGSVATKFIQAATALVGQVRRRRVEFGDDEALRCYEAHVRNGHNPGLGKNKELQLRHHIRVMLDVIGGSL
jgi:hypothetical protein